MDRIREVTSAIRDFEGDLLGRRRAVANTSYISGLTTSVLSTIFALVMFAAVLFLIQRNLLQASRANLQLHVEKENLRVTLSSIGDAVIATDRKGRITSLNPIAESLTGWTNEQAHGESLTHVFQIFNESTRMPVDNPSLRAIAEGAIVGLANHTILIAKDGTEWPIDDSAAPIRDADGNLVGSVLVFRDISNRKRETASREEAAARLRASEERVRMALDAAEPGTWHVDPRTQSLTSDARFREIFGKPGASITYSEAFDFIHAEDRARVEQAVSASES